MKFVNAIIILPVALVYAPACILGEGLNPPTGSRPRRASQMCRAPPVSTRRS